MNILFLDAYFAPEKIAFSHLEKDLIDSLVSAGHEIFAVCPLPTRGIDKETIKKYRKKTKEESFGGRVHITRFWAPQEKRNPLARALRYFWCNWKTYRIGKKMKNIDAVFANSTPPTQGWIAGKVAQKLGVPFIYSLQDVFPDSLVTAGIGKENSFVWKIGRKMEKATYEKSSKIIVISRTMKENLMRKGVSKAKLEMISNWVDTKRISPVVREENTLFEELNIDRKKYIVLYAGNFGAAQGAGIILEAAEKLRDYADIHFVIFGGGAEFPLAVKRAKQLQNVTIHPLLKSKRIAEVYSMGDVALITCRKGVGKSAMPSKTWSIMACNTPIIASFDENSEISAILKDAGAGLCIEPENADLLAGAILEYYRGGQIISGGRSYVEHNASKAICAMRYVRIFESEHIVRRRRKQKYTQELEAGGRENVGF